MITAEARSTCHFTTGRIAERLGVPLHKVNYVIMSRGIAPVGRMGRYRVFDEAAVARIAQALAETGAATRDVAS